MGTNGLLVTKAKHPTDAVFGVDPDGNTVIIPIASGPHIIIAGTTGSGKSVYVNGILISIMLHTLPRVEIFISWIDPKKVEATNYVNLPFSFVNPITNMNDAFGFLQYMTWLMDDRYEKLSELNFRKIDDYNDACKANPEKFAAMGCEPWPYHIVVIDEFADLMMTNPEVEQSIARLAQKARAAGVHVLIATQRPSVNVISGMIKANVPSRVGLKTASGTDSQIILDEGGCETLRGRGDSLIKCEHLGGSLVRCQGAFISDDEIANIFKYLRDTYGESEFFDYKQRVVDLGLAEWDPDSQDESMPWEKRHLQKISRSRMSMRR